MGDDPRLWFRCSCSNALSAPPEWRGRTVRCPACSAALRVPDSGDADLAAAHAGASRRAEVPRSGPSPDEWSIEADAEPADGGAHASTAAVEVARSFERDRRRAARRRIVVRVALVVGLAATVGGGLWWRKVWREEYSAAGRMKKRGFGMQIEEGRRPDPALQKVMGDVRRAEQRFEEGGRALEDAERLLVAYRAAIAKGSELPDSSRASVCNNAAWMLATARFVSLRDPDGAVPLAEAAVELTARKSWMYLDTLAESLWSAGRFGEAVRVGREALTEAAGSADPPSRDYLARQLAKFEVSAGGGTQSSHPAGTAPPPAGTTDLP